ncbi:MAG TPA: autotransporter assembly complex family protein [Xanthobacteraceae bacterium]|nr:autotransporter assembly complex family protein [Xanthobacteraceae bacterium]
MTLLPATAFAFDFNPFNWFGDDDPPAVSRTALPYALTYKTGDADDLTQTLKDASNLYKLRADAPPDGETLVRRAQTDLMPLTSALWGAGYYDASTRIDVAGVTVRPNTTAGAAAVERFRNSKPVPVTITADPGPLFKLRSIAVVDARTGRPFPADELPRRIVPVASGDPARSTDLAAAQAAVIDYFRGQSYPLAKARDASPLVDHRAHAMDITFVIDRGPKAPFGPVAVHGKSNVDPRVVRSYIYIEPGDPYSPDTIARTRKSVLTIPAISSIRIREPDHLDANGQLPIVADVTDRKLHVIGASARYSTLDGPALHTYWQDRNLFGGAESLRLEGDIFVPPRDDRDALSTFKDFKASDLGGRFKAIFVKPALAGTRNDLLLDAMAERDRTGGDQYGGYDSNRVVANAAIKHRFSDMFSVQAGVTGDVGRTSDSLGNIDYRLFGVPVTLNYDSTDKPLDPTKGFRVTATATTYPEFFGSSVGFTEALLRASTYYAVDEDARVVLAGRIAAGSLFGESTDLIPANHRFYAGGGGSVRGYRYRSLSPLGPTGQVVGGSNLLEASFETRVKITDTIGLVPFFDAGGAFSSSYSNFSENIRTSAGLGLRYYTAIGPIRLDVAIPLDRRPGDAAYAFYVGIGQAF